jgi:uncharacterized membrane protein
MNIYKIKIPKSILNLLVFALVLNTARIFLFGTTSFVYMFWNIFLAFVPFFISSILLIHTNKENFYKPFFIIGFMLWFLFLPNAPYVITDLIHLGRIRAVPVMYDSFLLFSSATVSLLMGLYSLQHIEKILSLKFSKRSINISIIVIILFTSFGMYLGRFLRFNSWDFFTSHVSLLSRIWEIFSQPNNYINVYAYTLLFFFFIYLSYLSFKSKD